MAASEHLPAAQDIDIDIDIDIEATGFATLIVALDKAVTCAVRCHSGTGRGRRRSR